MFFEVLEASEKLFASVRVAGRLRIERFNDCPSFGLVNRDRHHTLSYCCLGSSASIRGPYFFLAQTPATGPSSTGNRGFNFSLDMITFHREPLKFAFFSRKLVQQCWHRIIRKWRRIDHCIQPLLGSWASRTTMPLPSPSDSEFSTVYPALKTG